MKGMSKLAMGPFQAGQKLHGQHGLYRLLKPLSHQQNNVWLAMGSAKELVVVKTAPPSLMKNELEALRLCKGHDSIRQLIDETQEPPSLVLEYLDENLWYASSEQRLTKVEIKRAAKTVLDGLVILHGMGSAHTGTLNCDRPIFCRPTNRTYTIDIKPNNIFARNGNGNMRFSSFKLGDLGDSVLTTERSNNGFHIIGAPVFRAPEVMLNIPWTTAADIWSFGATVRIYDLGVVLGDTCRFYRSTAC